MYIFITGALPAVSVSVTSNGAIPTQVVSSTPQSSVVPADVTSAAAAAPTQQPQVTVQPAAPGVSVTTSVSAPTGELTYTMYMYMCLRLTKYLVYDMCRVNFGLYRH